MKSAVSNAFKAALVVCISIASFGCSSSSDSQTAGTTSVTGVVMAGPASGASVTVKSAGGAVVAGPVITGADGSYSITIPNSALSGALTFEASGGTFSDEATATSGVAMGTLTSYIVGSGLAPGATVAIDPSTTIIQKLIAGGKTKAEADSAFLAAFGYTPDNSIKPVFAAISSAATTSERLAGLRTAAFSQLTKDLLLPPNKQFELINSIASDLADGILDGGYTVATVAIPEDISNLFGQALVGFQMSANNKSKLTPDKIGAPRFNRVALTPTYRVEFLQGMTGAATGRTTFQIRLTTRADSAPATGLTNISLKPYMYMSSKSHTTPKMDITESDTPGTYDATIYYVMSTAMNGVSMGVWEVKVMIGSETATFYPDVAMAMGTTSLAKILGVNDKIMGMSGLENRTYFLFNDGIVREGMANTYTVKLFTATKEMLTNFPAVYNGTSLRNESGTDWTVSGMVVEVSNDKTNWTPLADASGNGHWSVSGITPDTGNKIYFRLTVNGEQKTIDGAAVGVANGYQTFTIVSGNAMEVSYP
ncbi:MAG: hypothetical protein PHY09_16520 [Desulfuromonadaceae bacterium]|nr:hypothetical protein [Desulfuromonadaceae bacterium]MDD5106328.1 hypothetical protein [Desulfuromonadaceae bacterium]